MAKKKKVEIPERKVVWHIQDDGSVSPIIQNQKQDIAPVQTKQSGFFKGSDAKNNWSIETDNPFMNVVQRANATLWGTILDAGTNVVRGATSSVEGIGDFAQNRVADVQDLFGHSKAAEKTRRKSEQVWGINQKIDDFDSMMNTTSVLGDKSDAVFQGVGTSLFAMGTGALGGAIGGTNAAASILSLGTMGLGASGNAENQARQEMMADLKKYGFNTKQINNASRMYGLLSGVGETLSEMMFGGISQTSKVLGIGSGVFDSADDAVINALTKRLKTGIFKNFVQAGLKASGEGVEEIASGFLDAAAKKLTYMKDEDFGKLLKDEKLLDSFISGTLSATITQMPSYAKSVGLTPSRSFKAYSNNEIRDFVSNLNTQEQQVVEREIENRLAQEENPSNRRKMQIEKQVIEDLDRGYISANTIRETLGENYNPERDIRLNESFNEETRRSQAYENDTSKYDEKQRATIQRAIDSGLLNNSNKTHDFVDLIAKLSADKGIDFDFTNNERIKESGFAVEGRTVNGFIQDGKIALNLESNQVLNKTVGHEITHVLEGTDLYKSLQDSLKSFIGKREWTERLKRTAKVYEGKDANIENELTSDLVGEYVFNDESFVKNLSTRNPNLFQKIFDEIKYMVKIATAGSKEARDLEKVKRAFEKAYRDSKTNVDGTKYHISKNAATDIDNVLKDINYRTPVLLRDYTPSMLVQNGIKDLPMYENPSHIRKNILTESEAKQLGLAINKDDNYHGLGKDTFIKAVDSLDDPRAIFKNNNTGDYIVLTTIKDSNNNTIIVPIEIETTTTANRINIDINRIKSIYGYDRNNPDLNKYIKDNINSNKFTKIYEQKKSKSTSKISQSSSLSDNNISQNNDNVKYSITEDSNGNEELTLYHGTSLNAAFKIQKYGFVPNSAIGADGGAANYNYFTNSRINAETYRDRKDRYSGQLLRVKKTADMQIDDRIVGHKKGEYDFRTQRNVTPDEIQILTEDGYWTPISNYDLYTDTPVDQKVIDKSLLYDDDGNKVRDVKYSLTEDNQGRELSKEQQEYFKDAVTKNENGELQVYYNGGGDYTSFDNTKMSDQSKWGKGIYLTKDSNIASGYGDNVKEVYANITNPISQTEKTISFEQYNDLTKALYDEEAFRDEYDMYDNDLDLLWDATNKGNWADYANEIKQYTGKDGLIIEDEDVREDMAIAFQSNQIKNIDNTNPTSNPDIRYSLSTTEEMEKYNENRKNVFKQLDKDFGGGLAIWEANLEGRDYDDSVRYLKQRQSIKDKFTKENNIVVEEVKKPVEYRVAGNRSTDVQNYIKDNNITMEKLINEPKVQQQYFKELEKAMLKEDWTQQEVDDYLSKFNDYFESQRQRPSEDLIWPLLRFQGDIENIIEGKTEEVDNIETAKRERELIDDSPEFDKYVKKYVDQLFNTKPVLDAEEVMEEAKYNHGTTDDYSTGAYMTTDGSLLDFNSHGYRDDHRTIDAFDLSLQEFMDYGAIRMQPEGNGFEISIEPTSAQYSRLEDYIDNYLKENGDKIYVDCGKEGQVYSTSTPTSKIINDIKAFFRDGTFPKQSEYAQFMYSLSEAPKQDNQGRELSEQQQEKFKDSKIRDNSGRLMEVYHGTNADFTVFDKSYLGSASGDLGFLGDGFYFATHRGEANYYGGKNMAVYLDVKNPYNIRNLQDYKGMHLRGESSNPYIEIKNLVDMNPEWGNIKVNYGNTYQDIANATDRILNSIKVEDLGETEEGYHQFKVNKGDNFEIVNTLNSYTIDEVIADAFTSEMRNEFGFINGSDVLQNITSEAQMRNLRNETPIKTFSDVLQEQGYDGIMQGDIAEYTDEIVVFDSNQVKSVDNLNPTENEDIRYQLGNNEVAPTSGWNVRSEDVRLQSAFQDTIAPLQEQVQQLNDTINRLEERIAPLSEQEADELYQETQRGFENELAPTRENLTQEENQRLDMLDLLERNNMLTDEQRYEREQLQSKENPINLEQEVTPGQALSDIRDTKEIGSPKVKAYQYEHPEVKPYFQEEARRMLSDLDNTTSGGRYVTERTDSMYGDWHGIKRFTSPEIAALLDGEYGAKYQKEDIRKGLNAIIEDHGAENIAVAKRIELVLDERLRNGYDAWGVLDENGEQYHVEPNSEYLNMLAEQEWQNYFDDIANQYPIDDNQAQYAPEQERQQEEQYKIDKSLEEMTADDINLEPFLEGLQGARERQAERQQLREEINQKKEVKIPKRSNGKRAVNRGLGLLVNEFAVLDDYSKQTKNKDIKFKTDTYNNYQAIAQSNIETAQTDINGKRIGRSGNSIFEEAKRYGLADTFDEYLKQWANVDRAKQGKGAANFSAKESYKIVKEMEAKNPRLKKLGKDMWQYYRNARHNLRAAGIISQEISDMLGRMYPHYTPYISENIENYFVKDGELKPKATIKRAKGGAAIGSLLNAEEAMQRYTKSEFNTIFGNDLFKEIVKTSNDIVQLGGDDRGMQFVNADNLYADKNGYYLTAYENGNPITAKISEDMYRTLTRESRNRISDIENTFSAVTKPLQAASNIRRNILTSWSPTFMAKNFIKDFQEGIFNSKYTKDFIKNYPSAFKELATNTEMAQQFKSLYGSGLTMGQYDIDANNYNPSGKNRNFLKGIKNVNELIELAPRYAEFKASIDHGASIQEAMYNAREVTTNFSRGGTLAKALNRNGFTFLNSSIQGFDKFIRNFSGENGAKGIVNSLAKAAIFGIAPAVFNELAFGSGDDKDEEYEALPDYIKDNYYIIKTGDGNFIRIPKGRVFSVFGSAARRTIEAMEGEENAFEGYWNNVQQQIGINNPEENNIFAPLIQAMGGRKLDSGQTAGEAWYGGDIIPSRLQKERPEDQYDASIDKLSIWLGQRTGISPYKINYVLDQYTGGMGDIGLPMITDEANSDGSIIAPIKDQFTADTITDNKYVSEFYDTKNKLYTGSKATDEDILKSKYMNDISLQMGQLYAERRKVQEDNSLTKEQKYKKAQEIKKEINRLAKEGLDNYEKVGITGDYADTNGQEYQKTEDGWRKLNENTSDELNLLGLTSREKNNYIKTKQNISSIKEKYKDTDDYNGKKNEIIGEIINTNLDDNSKLSLYQDTYRDKLADSIDDLGINADTYLEYKAQDFSADKDKNGKSISGSKKRKVFDYINALDIPYQQKLILAKSEYNSFNDNNYEIIEYIENSGMDYSERIELYKNLGFKVDGDNISW